MTQKCAAGAKAVPVLWRDCAWPIRIFVHTRIGRYRAIASGARLVSSVSAARRADLLVRGKVGHPQSFRSFTTQNLRRNRCGYECPRTGKGSHWRRRMSPQSKGCAPRVPTANNVARNVAAGQLRPVLAFAAWQLGGLAASELRIYSIFVHRLPTSL